MRIDELESAPDGIALLMVAEARSDYQRSLLSGDAQWSGADLRGTAKKWGAGYARTRQRLVARINATLPSGWTAERTQVIWGTPRRSHTELVLTDPAGTKYLA